MKKYYFVVLAQLGEVDILRCSDCLYESEDLCCDSLLNYKSFLYSVGYRVIDTSIKSIDIVL